ncbi:MAG: PAS domain S-box protein [Planctomycetota bacterium]
MHDPKSTEPVPTTADQLASAFGRSTHIAVVMADIAHRIVWVNEGFERLTGYSREEAIGQTPGSFLQCERTDPEMRKTIRERLGGGGCFGGEILNRTKGGREYWVRLDIEPRYDDNGEHIGFLSFQTDVTALKESELEGKRLRERFGIACDAAALGVWDMELRTGTLVWDEMMFRLYGARQGIDTPSYQFWRERLHRDDREETERRMSACIGEGGRFDHTFRIVTPDGDERVIHAMAMVTHDADGTPDRLLGVNRDCTEEHRVALEARRSRELLEQTGRIARIGGWSLDRATMTPTWSDEVYRLHEVEVGEQPPLERAIDFYAPEARPLIADAVRLGFEEGRPWDLVVPFVTAKGNRRWIRTIGLPDMQGGSCVRLWGTFQDITEQHTATRRLDALEQRMRLFIEHTPAAVAMFDRDIRYLVASRGWYAQYGIESESVIGRSHYDVFPTIPDRWREHHARALAGEQLRAERDSFTDGAGNDVWLKWDLRPWHDDSGDVGGIVMFTEVINEQIEHERRLEASNRSLQSTMEELQEQTGIANALAARAEAASSAKSVFLANMSHEIRTPMTAIMGYADLLAAAGDEAIDPQHAEEAVASIRSNAGHLLALINDILDMSKIEAGKMIVEEIATDPLDVVHSVRKLLRQRAEGKGLELSVVCETPVPRTITSDPTRLRQILVNMVGNAIKFTETGSVCVAVSHDSAGGGLVFEVRDTGVGMSASQLRRVLEFEAFTQADSSTTRTFGGTGLGLRISDTFARMLGGGLDATSRKGEGSTFRLTVATGAIDGVEMVEGASASQAHEAPSEESVSDSAGDALCLAGVRVLLAEDGPDNQRLIAFHLRRAGAEVTIAENGRVALELIAEDASGYDVVLMDMQMPELDGYQTTARIRAAGHTHPIIALTAHAMGGDREKCLGAGCDDFQTKPIDREGLIGAVARWSGSDRSSRAA